MFGIAVPENAAVTVKEAWTAPIITNAYNSILTLIVDHDEWLNGVHRTANEELYLLLQRCYHLYKVMSSDKELNKKLKAAIEKHDLERNLGIDMKSHSMTNIIKVVFGADRRRASSYSTALRVADAEKVEVKDLPNFLREAGGVEEVRRKQANCGAPKVDKVAEAIRHTSTVTLSVISEDAISSTLDGGAIGKPIVLLATQDVNATLKINAVVQTEGVANAVLTAIYNANHKAWADKGKQQEAVSEADELAAMIEAAANSVQVDEAA